MYDFSHPKIKTAFEAVVACANKHGKPVLSAVNPCAVEQSNKLSEIGVKKQHFSSDLNIIGGAFKTLMDNVVSQIFRK